MHSLIGLTLFIVLAVPRSGAAAPSTDAAPRGQGEAHRADPCAHLPPGHALGRDQRCPPPGSSGGIARGDFNRDGFPDLAIGVPDKDVGGVADAGEVIVVYGNPSGLGFNPPRFAQAWNQDTVREGIAVEGNAEAGDRFGSALASGDFDGDGFSDLAIGAPYDDVAFVPPGIGCFFSCPLARDAGAVNVLYGSSFGLTAARNRLLRQSDGFGGVSTIPGAVEEGDRFGAALVWGDFDGDGVGDLAIGVPSEDSKGVLINDPFNPLDDVVIHTVDDGAVNVVYGTRGVGLTDTDSQLWRQGMDGIRDLAENGDAFGTTLAAGDVNRDGISELVIGAPNEDLTAFNAFGGTVRLQDAGGVHVLYGSGGGLFSTNNQFLHQGGVLEPGTVLSLDTAEAGDRFGAAVAVGDFNGNGFGDLAVGVPGENSSSGIVQVAYGLAGGLVSSGQQLWHQQSAGFTCCTVEPGDLFGQALAAGDFNRDGRADLAVGAPFEAIGSILGAGVVNVIYGSAGGLTAAGNQLLQQGGPGLGATPEAGDLFGLALSAWDFTGEGFRDLVVGVPYEDVGTVVDSGVVHVVYGSTIGLLGGSGQLLQPGTLGIPGVPESGARFGLALY